MAKTKILLVIEDALRAANIRALLEEHGHDAFHVRSIGEASEALEIQRFQLVLLDSPLGRMPNWQALDRFSGLFQNRARPLLVMVREDAAAIEPFHLSTDEPDAHVVGADAVIEGRFSSSRLTELVNELVHKRIPRSSLRTAGGPEPIFERDQFERQMNHDRRLMAEIIHLFVTETTDQIAALQTALDGGLDAQVKRLAHTLKGSFGAVYAHKARAVAREMEAAAGDLSSARMIMPRLQLAAMEIQSKLQKLLAD